MTFDLRPVTPISLWMPAQTDALVKAVDPYAREPSGRPITHWNTWRMDKDQRARKRQEQAGIDSGLIGVWSCLEGCWSYRAFQGGRRPAARHRLQVESEGKHRYLHLRPATFTSLYWTLWQSEWATDLIVDTPAELTATMASILRHAWITGNSANVLRYLGRPLTGGGKPYANSNNEVMSRVLDFHDGLRVRHWVDHNRVKVYHEFNNFRIETTINMPYMFKVYRRAQGQPRDAAKKLRPLRKGVADIPLRAQVSQEVNDRLMDKLSTFTNKTPLSELLAPHVHSRTQDGRRVRALDISGKDRKRLQAISDPAFTVSGMSNAALRKKLSSTGWAAGRTDKPLSARVSRHLRLLRDHGLIRKLPNRNRYHLTDKGRQLTTALHAVLSASTEQLLDMAA